MRGIKVVEPRRVEVVEWKEPALGPNDVRIRIRASALCGSDLKLFFGQGVRGNGFDAFVPGHEPAGAVEEVGAGVAWPLPGDRVAVICFDGCGHCRYCRHGSPNLCSECRVIGFDRHGGDAETLVVPAAMCLPLPDWMSFRLAAVATDAIGNLYNTMKELRLGGHERLVVLGVGPMGLAAVLCAKAVGAEVVAVDIVERRLETAKRLGADHAFVAAEAADAIERLTGGDGVEAVVDCSGREETIALAFKVVGRLGRIAQIGHGGRLAGDSWFEVVRKQTHYFGSWYFRTWEWDEVCDFVGRRIGSERAEQIISHVYPLEPDAVQEAWSLFSERRTNKVVFTP